MYIQLTNTVYNSQIGAFLPAVSDFLIGTDNQPGYLNNSFLVTGTADVTATGLENVELDDWSEIFAGNTILIDGVTSGATGAVITDFDEDAGEIEIDLTPTTIGTSKDLSIRITPIGIMPTVAAMVWYKTQKQNITMHKGKAKSEKIEDYSITYSDEWSKLGAGGYPLSLLSELSVYKTPRFQ